MSAIKKLIEQFQDCESFPIKVDDIRDWIIKNGYQDQIDISPVDIDQKILKGLMRQYTYRPKVYGEPVRVTEVCYAKSLNKCWERFVCCKEFCHILDGDNAKTSSQEIEKLIIDITSPVQPDKPTDAYLAEKIAYFKALFILAPLQAIEQLRPHYESGTHKSYDIALFFRIPEVYVSFLFTQTYKDLLQSVLITTN